MSTSRSKTDLKITKKEIAILELVAKGLGNRRIAEILVISDRTVASHISNLIQKTGCDSRFSLVVELIEKGYLKPIGTTQKIQELELKLIDLQKECDRLTEKLKSLKYSPG